MLRFLLCFLFLFFFALYAQETKKETDNHPPLSALVANYPLTKDFLLKLEKIENECKNLLPKIKYDLTAYDSIVRSNIENYTSYISRKPEFMNILKENDLTAKDFAAGTLTLEIILMMLLMVPEEAHYDKEVIISQNNIEFVKKYLYKAMTLLGSCKRLLFPLVSYAKETKEETDDLFHPPLVANYPLTEDLLLKLEKIENECKNLPSEPKTAKIENRSIIHKDRVEEYIAYISRKPEFISILKENNLTPKDFVFSHLTLQTTLIVLTNEKIFPHGQNIVSSSNIEFAKEHMYKIIKILRGAC
ncbi:hypothetical protein [Bartonella florencae]|uniref:hypothetical protein n=1 Tax=Bartonella florencae TaxID=928210 RepID=UPI0002E70FF5|nr:hypothetical protein [Bartonella florencae]